MSRNDITEQIAERLTSRGVAFTIHEHVVARTVADALERLPCSPDADLKTVAFQLNAGGWVLAAARAGHVMIFEGLERIMAVSTGQTTYTPAEYLKLERAAETKSEYRYGQIVAMTGASLAHNRIVLNIGGDLRRQLRGGACEAFVNDLRVRVSRTGLYTYPDVVVTCGEIRFEDDHVDTLLNPVVVIEVLSPSTEAYDRGEKFAHYRRLDSLLEYVLVAQDKMRVERYVRQGEAWVLSELSGPDDVVSFSAIDCNVRLSDIYERVNLPSGSPEIAADDQVTPGASSADG